MKKKISLFVAVVFGLVFLAGLPGARAAEFYKGKTITFVVGFSAGGGFDN